MIKNARNMNSIMNSQVVEQDVLELARARTARAFDRFDHIAVSFSGGKDSTVVLELAIEEARKRGRTPVDVVFFDEEAIQPETVEYMQQVQQRPEVALRWFCLAVKHRNACSRTSPYWYPWAPEDEALWCRPLPEGAITDFPGFDRQPIPELAHRLFDPKLGSVGFMLGLRAQESTRRRWAVLRRVHDNFITKSPEGQVYIVKPIYDWKTEDVWTAPQRFGWGYNRAYDVMTMAGIARHAQRVCPPYGEEPLNGLWMYAQCWPELWDKMTARVPGAATAGRYAVSPLYAHGAISLPEGMTWEEYVLQAISRWPPDIAKVIRQRMKALIAFHNTKTRGKPLTLEADPVSGIGWRFLYKIASRGDLKGRKTRKMTHGEDSRDPDYFGEEEGRF